MRVREIGHEDSIKPHVDQLGVTQGGLTFFSHGRPSSDPRRPFIAWELRPYICLHSNSNSDV